MAGAKRPDGKAAKTERVTFTRPAAERIGRVVRIVEAGDRGAEGLRFTPRGGSSSPARATFRVCTYTGVWPIGEEKEVTFKYETETPNTVSATNLFWPLDYDDTTGRDCCVSKDGDSWFLVTPQLDVAQVFTAVTVSSTKLTFKTLPAIVLATASDNTVSINLQTVTMVESVVLNSSNNSIDVTRRRISVLDSQALSTSAVSFNDIGVAVDVVTSVTVTSDAVQFRRVKAWALRTATADAVSLSITTCATATT